MYRVIARYSSQWDDGSPMFPGDWVQVWSFVPALGVHFLLAHGPAQAA